jgi:hypothetical protein
VAEISKESYDKAVGQFNLTLNGIFEPFMYYGQDVYIAQAKIEVLKIALALHQRLNGFDVPIMR